MAGQNMWPGDIRLSVRHPYRSRWDALGCLVAGLTGLVLVALTVVGLITVLRWAW
ncbi:hypothetical protein [Micromonospora zamorensis]|uniref:hypothetical protein n=1 Tax=Micromonospora zamorensis TaxID=709883 RepID=UPI0033A51CDD